MDTVVEVVTDRPGLRRFSDLPLHLHRRREGWVPPVTSLDRWRLDEYRNPHLAQRDLAVLVARRGGRVVGRAVVSAGPGDDIAWWGMVEIDTGGLDDGAGVCEALVAGVVAAEPVRTHRPSVLRGPVGVAPDDDVGLRTDGFDTPASTGMPWHPPEYQRLLREMGARRVSSTTWWRRALEPTDADADAGEVVGASLERDVAGVPAALAPYVDRRLAVPGAVVVPDVVGGLATVGIRGAWRAARRARRHDWDGAVVLVPASGEAVRSAAAAAAAAGYSTLTFPGAGSDTASAPSVAGTVTVAEAAWVATTSLFDLPVESAG